MSTSPNGTHWYFSDREPICDNRRLQEIASAHNTALSSLQEQIQALQRENAELKEKRVVVIHDGFRSDHKGIHCGEFIESLQHRLDKAQEALKSLREEFSGHIMQFDDGDIDASDYITNVLAATESPTDKPTK